MENIQEHLAYLQETKEQIKQAIVNKGQTIADNTTFREYVNEIEDIYNSDNTLGLLPYKSITLGNNQDELANYYVDTFNEQGAAALSSLKGYQLYFYTSDIIYGKPKRHVIEFITFTPAVIQIDRGFYSEKYYFNKQYTQVYIQADTLLGTGFVSDFLTRYNLTLTELQELEGWYTQTTDETSIEPINLVKYNDVCFDEFTEYIISEIFGDFNTKNNWYVHILNLNEIKLNLTLEKYPNPNGSEISDLYELIKHYGFLYNATAEAEDIAYGKTAFIEGWLQTGRGMDNFIKYKIYRTSGSAIMDLYINLLNVPDNNNAREDAINAFNNIYDHGDGTGLKYATDIQDIMTTNSYTESGFRTTLENIDAEFYSDYIIDLYTTLSPYYNNNKIILRNNNNVVMCITFADDTTKSFKFTVHNDFGEFNGYAVEAHLDTDAETGDIRFEIDNLYLIKENRYEEKIVTPATSSQIIIPTRTAQIRNNALSKVTVNAVTSSIDSNIIADNIKSGVTILGVTGTYTEQMKEYASETEMNNDIANISEGEIVKVVTIPTPATITVNNNTFTLGAYFNNKKFVAYKTTHGQYPYGCIVGTGEFTVSANDVSTNIREANCIDSSKYVASNNSASGNLYTTADGSGTYTLSQNQSNVGYFQFSNIAFANFDVYDDLGNLQYEAPNKIVTFYLKETTMKKLVKEEETISPQEYEENVEITEDILGNNGE